MPTRAPVYWTWGDGGGPVGCGARWAGQFDPLDGGRPGAHPSGWSVPNGMAVVAGSRTIWMVWETHRHLRRPVLGPTGFGPPPALNRATGLTGRALSSNDVAIWRA